MPDTSVPNQCCAPGGNKLDPAGASMGCGASAEPKTARKIVTAMTLKPNNINGLRLAKRHISLFQNRLMP
jgi:hypothetical protein